MRYGGVFVVVPSIREDCLHRFLDEWSEDFKDAQVIVIEDNPERTFTVPEDVIHVSWTEIDRDLGDDRWIIPRRTSANRSYGTLLAYRAGADIIWHLDDDCYPEDGRKGNYLSILSGIFGTSWEDDQWWNTIDGSGMYPRGYPYKTRAMTLPTMLNHGLWSNVPDLDGVTQLEYPDFRLDPSVWMDRVPHGKLFPMCGMNLAFRNQVAPLMYMQLQGHHDGYRYDRFDDMWCGLFMKLTFDHLNWVVTSGSPSVHHSRASNAERNKIIEEPGIKTHEVLWEEAKAVSLAGCVTPAECYLRFADMIDGRVEDNGYWKKLSEAMRRWTYLMELC